MSEPSQPGPPYPEQPYGQQPYGQQPYAQQPYPQPVPGQPTYTWAPKPPEHPSATTAMVLGLIGLVGILVCGGLTLVVSPFAWAIGSRALREIDADPAAYSGREMASAGRVMGIVGTGLLAIGVVVALGVVVLIVGVATTSP
jgi:hypothetical protein